VSGVAERIRAHLTERAEGMRALLERLVEAESPSHDADAQREVMALLTEALVARGMRVRRARGRRSGGALLAVDAERRRGGPYQVLVGHCDTVWPLGTLETMPLGVEDETLRGPGSYDMKAGLVQGLFALDAMRAALGGPPAVAPVFVINSDEEIGSRESTPLIRRVARGADRVFVLEPSLGPEGKLKTARKGIGRFTVKVKGRAAHAGLEPDKGASAILELSHVVQALFALNDPERGVTVNVGQIDGGLGANVVAPESAAVVDVRVPTHEDARRVEAAIHALEPVTPGTALEIEGRIGRPPMEPTPGNRRLWRLAQRAADELGLAVDEASVGGGSDGNTTSQYAPTLDGLGAVGEGAHAPNEQLRLDRMVERAALLALLLTQPPLAEAMP
jgi:glutamate carboxypeptidase